MTAIDAAITAVTPLVQAIYDERYGPEYWPLMDQHHRNLIVQYVIDQARNGVREVIAHEDANRKQYTLNPADVLTRIGDDQ